MITKAEKFRDFARHAGEKATKAHSDDEGAMQRRRQSALIKLAENEDWLAGNVRPSDDAASDHSSG
jgi:hypothetical protein